MTKIQVTSVDPTRIVVSGNMQGPKGDAGDFPGVSPNGIVTQTSTGAYAGRTITGTANRVTVVNGDGVSGNPTLSLPQDVNGTANVQFGSVTTESTSLQQVTGQRTDATSSTTGSFVQMGHTVEPTATDHRLAGFVGRAGSTNTAGVTVWSSEAWGVSAKGGYLRFETTPAGSTTRAERMRLTDTALTLQSGMDINIGTVSIERQANMLTSSKGIIPTGAFYASFDRTQATSIAATTTLTSQRLKLYATYLVKGQVVTSISFISGTTGMTTGVNQWFALYDASRNRLALTADDTSTAWAGGTTKTLSLTTPYTITTSGLYYVGIMVNATTPPQLFTITGSSTLNTLPPIVQGDADTGLTNPASAPATATAITASAVRAYFWLS